MEAKSPIKVVVADDSLRVREHLVSMLSALDNVEVVGEADDGETAIEQVRRFEPEVVVLDLQMPRRNGIFALRHIKQDYPNITVIMLTNHADPFYRTTCLRAGASYFFDKTIEFEKVGGVLSQIHEAAA